MNVGVDVVALRTGSSGVLEVFSTKRGAKEKAAPNVWHVPGTILRPHEDFQVGFRRLETWELGVSIAHATLIDEAFASDERGSYLMKTFLVTLEHDPPVGRWFSVEALPMDYFALHRDRTIPVAVRAYLRSGLASLSAGASAQGY